MTSVVWPVALTMTGSCGRGRDQVSDLLDLGHHLGQRLVGIEIELDVGGDRAGPLDRGRGQVIDPLGGRDRLRQGRGDKALHQIRRRRRDRLW